MSNIIPISADALEMQSEQYLSQRADIAPEGRFTIDQYIDRRILSQCKQKQSYTAMSTEFVVPELAKLFIQAFPNLEGQMYDPKLVFEFLKYGFINATGVHFHELDLDGQRQSSYRLSEGENTGTYRTMSGVTMLVDWDKSVYLRPADRFTDRLNQITTLGQHLQKLGYNFDPDMQIPRASGETFIIDQLEHIWEVLAHLRTIEEGQNSYSDIPALSQPRDIKLPTISLENGRFLIPGSREKTLAVEPFYYV